MRIACGELPGRLRESLPPIIVLHGEEPLLIEESSDRVRAAAQTQGYAERVRLTVEPGFDWQQLHVTGQSLSLFAERRLLELRMPSGRPGDAGGKALAAYAADPPEDTVLLVITGRLDTRARQARWFSALQTGGFSVDHRAVRPEQLPGWISARLKARGLSAEPQAISLLAHHTEGNLLAAAQEVDKLALIAAGHPVTSDDVLASTADHARFNIYALADMCLAGNHAKALRMLRGMRREGVEPVLLVWVLAREVRTLVLLAWGLSHGESRSRLFKAHRVWNPRQAVVNSALGRLPLA
ncbi:MAG: DNA polymerase III subunit delta, partial [Gammaproteobacteria bacterium]|nr:DNA polymerase III subunit delta [Gammaproteobacteria bacterium]